MAESRKAADVLARHDDARQAAARLFRTHDGKLVYKMLMDMYYHNQFTVTEEVPLARMVGRRDVALTIRSMVKLEDEDG